MRPIDGSWVLLVAAFAWVHARYAHRRGWWWLLPVLCVAAAGAEWPQGWHWPASVIALAGLGAVLVAVCADSARPIGLLALILVLQCGRVAGGRLVALTVQPDPDPWPWLVAGAGGVIAAQAGLRATPPFRAMYYGLLGLVTAATIDLLSVGALRPASAGAVALATWLPLVHEGEIAPRDRSFGQRTFHGRALVVLLIVVVGLLAGRP